MAQQIIVTKDNYGIGLSCNFIDNNKKPIDLTDKVVEVVIVDSNNETIDIKQAVIVDYTNAKASIVLEKIHTSTLGLHKTFWSVLDENQNITAQEDVYYYVKDKNNGSEGNVDSGFDVEDVFENLEDRLEESEDSLKELEKITNDLNEQLETNTSKINYITITVDEFKTINNTDDEAIDLAINFAKTLISTNDLKSGFSGVPRLKFSSREYTIAREHTLNEPISLYGDGVGTVFNINANLGSVFKYVSDNKSKCKNEEGQLEGGTIENLRFLNNRTKAITSCITIQNTDHMVIRNIWAYGIKGSVINLRTFREGFIENIFTRFCGKNGVGIINVEENLTNHDTTNLNFGQNWSIIFPYSPSIKMINGQFTEISNYTVHGIFIDVFNKLINYFPNDEESYNNEGFSHIDLLNSNIGLSHGSFSYNPDKNANFKLSNSKLMLNKCYNGGEHYSKNEGASGYENSSVFELNNGSIVYLYSKDNRLKTYNGKGNFVTGDGTGVIYGDLFELPLTLNLGNGKLIKKKVVNEIILNGSRNNYVSIKPNELNAGNFANSGFMYGVVKDSNDSIIFGYGLTNDKTQKLFAIDNNSAFKIPITATNASFPNGSILIDNDRVKYKASNSYFTLLRKVDVPANRQYLGEVGDYAVDSNYLYICYNTNRWLRIQGDSTTW